MALAERTRPAIGCFLSTSTINRQSLSPPADSEFESTFHPRLCVIQARQLNCSATTPVPAWSFRWKKFRPPGRWFFPWPRRSVRSVFHCVVTSWRCHQPTKRQKSISEFNGIFSKVVSKQAGSLNDWKHYPQLQRNFPSESPRFMQNHKFWDDFSVFDINWEACDQR